MSRARLLIVLLAVLVTLVPAGARATPTGVSGVWLSPDWILPGPRAYNEEQVRQATRRCLEELAANGVDTVFLETWLRGYSLAPGIRREGHRAGILPFRPGLQGLPLYRHLSWDYRILADEVQDPLQIFIDEARPLGIQVHAWCHAFYWKMDNTSAMLPWHSGPSMWNDLMARWLRDEAGRLQGSRGAAPDTLALMAEAADLYDRTSEDRELEKILNRHRVPHDGHPMGALLRQALRAGARNPGFLLVSSVEDPLPAPRGRGLRPVFLNPGDPEVARRLESALLNLAEGHPGLAGLHLDHIRYPVDGQGLPENLGIQSGSYRYFSPANRRQMERYRTCQEILGRREAALTELVNRIRAGLPRRLALSAAVLPLYYRERDNGRHRLSGYDFACQDWYRWKVDFVVPMLYEFPPHVIRDVLRGFRADLERLHGRQTIEVYPGVSHLQMARSGILDVDTWVFFDLTLARDVKYEKTPVEDLNFEIDQPTGNPGARR